MPQIVKKESLKRLSWARALLHLKNPCKSNLLRPGLSRASYTASSLRDPDSTVLVDDPLGLRRTRRHIWNPCLPKNFLRVHDRLPGRFAPIVIEEPNMKRTILTTIFALSIVLGTGRANATTSADRAKEHYRLEKPVPVKRHQRTG